MAKRVVCVFCTFIMLFTVVYYRVLLVSGGDNMAQVAKRQSTYTLEVAKTRAMIYDCNMSPLVNRESAFYAAVLPSPQSAALLQRLLPSEQFLAALESQKPMLIKTGAAVESGSGVTAFSIPRRYGKTPVAVHVIGHLRDGAGVCGLEQAYDDFLRKNGGAAQVRYRVDATGRGLEGEKPTVTDTIKTARRGLVLCIDERIQKIAEGAARRYLNGKGAVVVMDCRTGELRAVVSLPEFNPNDVAAALTQKDTPFVNKAFAPFNVGSGFKLVVMAAALENGIKPGAFECKGNIDVDGQLFNCNNRAGHGWVDAERALQVSCNPYFINLARRVGARALREEAVSMGFGKPVQLADGIQSAGGSLPSAAELQRPAALANFGFGQGSLMATPVQLARMVSVFANGGTLVAPTLVRGYSDDTGTALAEELVPFASSRVISPKTAEAIRELMVTVVEKGSGKRAKPREGGAGGKTGSAQTGRYYDAEKTNEVVEAWFIGFFPSEQPMYSVVVLAQGADSGSIHAAPVFKEIADSIKNIH
ncbi:MAG: penicillin-binding protein 2 [Hydrogenoanaerobacterium sp.]